MLKIIWASKRENLSSGFENNEGADQPVHSRSLISAFVIHLLESIKSKLAISEFSILYRVSVSEETGLSLILLENSKTGFVMPRPILNSDITQVKLIKNFQRKIVKFFLTHQF